MKTVRKFIAGNHYLIFGKYAMKHTVNELLEIDPEYLKWCKDNLKHIRFATGISSRINKSLIPRQ